MPRNPVGLIPTGALLLLLAACQSGGPHDAAPAAPSPPGSPASRSRQLILVVTRGWNAPTGFLRRYQRQDLTGTWRPQGPSIPVEVGRSGLGWGRGLEDLSGKPGPVKREGDGRGPAGIFLLSRAFGFAPPDRAAFVRLPYIHLVKGVECVDDRHSRHYNRIVQRSRVEHADWTSSERMWQFDDRYRWGIVADHNRPKNVSGAGSCIFLHIWEGKGRGTAGCTSMCPSDFLKTLIWVDRACRPVLVQLPESEYLLLRDSWGLP